VADEKFKRHYVALFSAVLALAAFNLFFRLGSEFVTDWDESLYAISSSEMLRSGDWIGTTFLGSLDYYNTKPPLNIWMLGIVFKTFGTNLVALRLVSAGSALLTVAVLMAWVRRAIGSGVALMSGLVLATSFAFLHVHAGRSANTDALFTLLVLLTVVVLWASESREWLRVWLGPLAAAIFMLRGMAVLMPMALIAGTVIVRRGRRVSSWWPAIVAVALFVLPVGAWVIARYQLDQWSFLQLVWSYDFVARTTRVIEEHPGGPLYYLDILQKHQYDWLIAGGAAMLLYPLPWRRIRASVAAWRTHRLATVVAVWIGATLLMPTVMRTKLPWYLNTFYPVFALGVGAAVVHAAKAAHAANSGVWRRYALALVVVVMFGVAETKAIYYSYRYRDIALTDQALMLDQRERLSGHQLFRMADDRAGIFVARDVVGAVPRYADNEKAFLAASRPGDLWITGREISHPDIELLETMGRFRLYRRCGEIDGLVSSR